MRRSDGIKEIGAAMAVAMRAIKPAKLDAKNPMFGSSYSTLGSVWDAIGDAINAAGLVVTQAAEPISAGVPKFDEDGDRCGVQERDVVSVVTLIMHPASGEWIESTTNVTPLPQVIDKGSKEKAVTPQSAGSAITYARRYALSALFNVCPEDDDGHRASSRTARTEPDSNGQEDLGTFEDVILDVLQRKTTGGHTLYTIETFQHGKLGTWSIDVAVAAKAVKGTDEVVIIESEPTKWGPQAKAIARKE